MNVSRKTGEAIAESIRYRIADGDLRAGDRLPTEEQFADMLGVARTTLREALRILEFQGLIRIKRGRGGGATITAPDLEGIAGPLAVILQLRGTLVTDLDEARRLIEPQLAARLAEHHTEDDLAALRTAVSACSAAAEADDREAFGLATARFHETIIKRAGNDTLSALSELLHRIVADRYLAAAERSNLGSMRQGVRASWKLVDLITDGEAERALAHWGSHMSLAMEPARDRRLEVRPVPDADLADGWRAVLASLGHEAQPTSPG